MKTTNDRIKKLRKKLDLSQAAFGERLCMAPSTISKLESGDREATDAFIKLVSQTFGVSEVWLRTGEGEMELPTPQSIVDQMARDYDLSPGKVVLLRAVARAFNELPEPEFNRILDQLLADIAAIVADRSG